MIKDLRFWVQKVLPLVYDDSLSYYELLCKTVDKLNEVIAQVNAEGGVDEAVEKVLNEWLENGTLEDIIGDSLDNLNSRVEALEGDVGVQKGKNIVFIGDSLSVGSGATNPETERFTTLVAKQFGMTEKNFAVGGAGFTRPNTFLAQVNRAASEMSAEEIENTTVVLICGGCNDVRWRVETGTTMAQFTSAVVECMNRAKVVFPKALICMAVGTSMNNVFYDTDRHWYYQAISAMKQSHNLGRVLIIDHVAASINGRSDTYTSDNLHPNTKGHSMFAGFICNAILGGGTDTEYYIGKYQFDEALVTEIQDAHVFRQTENILFGQGVIQLLQDISTNTQIGTYHGAYGYNNIYIPVYHANEEVGALGIGTTGNVRLIPKTGVTLSSEWQIRIPDHVELFRTLI